MTKTDWHYTCRALQRRLLDEGSFNVSSPFAVVKNNNGKYRSADYVYELVDPVDLEDDEELIYVWWDGDYDQRREYAFTENVPHEAAVWYCVKEWLTMPSDILADMEIDLDPHD